MSCACARVRIAQSIVDLHFCRCGPIIFLAVQSVACWWPRFLYSTHWKCDEPQFCQFQFAAGFRDRNGLLTLAELLGCVLRGLTPFSCCQDRWAWLCVEWEPGNASEVVMVRDVKLARVRSLSSLVWLVSLLYNTKSISRNLPARGDSLLLQPNMACSTRPKEPEAGSGQLWKRTRRSIET